MRTSILTVLIAVAALAGCHTTPLTPDECWHTYARYFNGNLFVATERPMVPVEIRRAERRNIDAEVKALTATGAYELVGRFDILDGTDVSPNAVDGLARHFKADLALWSPLSKPIGSGGLVNGDLGIPGVESSTSSGLYQRRPDEALSELTERSHVIVILNRKAPSVQPVARPVAPVTGK